MVVGVTPWNFLPERPKGFPWLPLPRIGRLVVLPDAAIKLPCKATDRAGISAIGIAETAAGKPSEMLVGRYKHHICAKHRAANRRHHRSARAAVNHDVVLIIPAARGTTLIGNAKHGPSRFDGTSRHVQADEPQKHEPTCTPKRLCCALSHSKSFPDDAPWPGDELRTGRRAIR